MFKANFFTFCIAATLISLCYGATTPPPTQPPTSATTTTTMATIAKTTVLNPSMNNVTYICTEGDDELVKITLTILDSEDTRAMTAVLFTDTNWAFGHCASTPSQDGSIHTLEIKFNKAGVQKYPLGQRCYVTPNGDNTVSVQVAVQSDPRTISWSDRIVKATCDLNDLASSQLKLGEGEIPVSAGLMPTYEQTIAKTPLGTLTATLVNMHHKTLYRVGDLVFIRVTYDYTGADREPYPKALFFSNLVMHGNTRVIDGIQFINEEGCQSEEVPDVTRSFTITKSVEGITTAQSPIFRLVLFKHSPRLVISMNYEANCYTADEYSACYDQQDYCDFGRSKRSVNDRARINGSLEFEIPVGLPSLSELEEENILGSQLSGQAGNDVRIGEETECVETASMYWILAVVLGALLLVVVIICLFLIVRLRYAKEKEVKIIDNFEGHKNNAYY